MTQSNSRLSLGWIYWLLVGILILFMIFFLITDISFLENKPASSILQDSIIRGISVCIFVIILIQYGYKHIFHLKITPKLFLSVVLPGLLIAFVNFPLSAYLKGYFEQGEPNYVGYLFIGASFITAAFEEIVFRGIIFLLLMQLLPKTKKGIITAVIMSSIIFGLTHVLNVYSGNPLSNVMTQIIYSTLMGGLWTVIFIKTRSIIYPILLHAFYNITGQILFVLGSVHSRYDAITVTTMVVISFLVAWWMTTILCHITSKDIEHFHLSNKKSTQ